MRGFSDEERERIREQLIETARELLLTYGPEKTTVTDITEPVGIAKSTFYRFFDTKSELYFVLYQREMEAWSEYVRSELAGVEDPREGLERLFWSYVEVCEESPLVQKTVIQGDYRKLFRSVPPETLETVQQEGLAELLPHIEKLRERSDGPLADVEPITVLGMMGGSIGLMALHRDEFEEYEEGYYKQVQETLISMLARGLTVEK